MRLRARWAAAVGAVRGASALGWAQAIGFAAAVVAVAAVFAHGALSGGPPDDAVRAPLGARPLAAHPSARHLHPRPLAQRRGHPRPLRAGRPLAGPSKSPPAQSTRPAGHRGGALSPAHRKPPAAQPHEPATAVAQTPLVVGVVYEPLSLTARLLQALQLDEKPGDAAAQAKAVAAWISAHGGIGGRPLEVRAVPFDPTADAPFAQACTALATGTLEPVAVVGRADDAAAQTACLSEHGLALVGDAPAVGDAQVFTQAGDHLFAPGSMALDRLARAYVRVLTRERFLDGASRVGILRIDEPMFERAEQQALRPALAAGGIKVVAAAALRRPRIPADAPATLAGVAAAVLRFRLAGVDHVLALDDGVATALFMRAAEALRYRPRYGLNSTMAPAALAGEVPRAQLEGAFGVGFAPLLDVSPGHEPDPSATRRRCDDVYRQAGVDEGPRTVAGQYSAVAICQAMLTVRAALERAREKTSSALPAAMARLGLGAARHDGAASVRPVRFDDACTCLEYAGPEEAVP